MKPGDVVKYAKENGAVMLDTLRYGIDLTNRPPELEDE